MLQIFVAKFRQRSMLEYAIDHPFRRDPIDVLFYPVNGKGTQGIIKLKSTYPLGSGFFLTYWKPLLRYNTYNLLKTLIKKVL